MHANSVVPEARGQAARVIQEAEGYKASTVALAEGEAQRFTLMLKEYQRAPEITRKRLYLQAMENVFSRSQKVLLDADSSGNIFYLPLDQLGVNGKSGKALLPPVMSPDSGPVGENAATSRTSRREGRQ